MEFCPYCHSRYNPDSDYCWLCGSLRVDFRFCSNPNCKNYDRPCGDNDFRCRFCGQPTAYGFHKLKRGGGFCGDLIIAAIFVYILYLIGNAPR